MTCLCSLNHLLLLFTRLESVWLGWENRSHICTSPARLPSFPRSPGALGGGDSCLESRPVDRDFLPGLSVPRKWKDCQLILLCSLLGLTATHPLQTKASVSCRELGRSGQVDRQLPLSWAFLDQIPRPRSFAFHFVWINFTLPHDSHFLSRLQIPEPEDPSREECRLIPLTCLLLRVRAGKIHIFRLHLYPSLYFF